MSHLGHNEFSILRTVKQQFLGYVLEGDAGVGEVDHTDAGLDDIVSQANNQCVGVVSLEFRTEVLQSLIKLGQITRPHSCKREYHIPQLYSTTRY